MANTDFAKDAERFLAPVRSLNELALSNANKLVDLQLDNTRKYASLVLDSLKEAAAVKDAEGAKSYVLGQVEAYRKLGESLSADSEALVQLSSDYAAEVQKIAAASVKNLPKRAA